MLIDIVVEILGNFNCNTIQISHKSFTHFKYTMKRIVIMVFVLSLIVHLSLFVILP